MYQSIWKLTALAVVVGIGVLVVVQAQRGFNNAEQDARPPADSRGDDSIDADTDARVSQADSELALDGFDDETPAIPALAKTGFSSPRRDRPDTLDGDDSFVPSNERPDRSPRRATSRDESRERIAASGRSRSVAVDEEISMDGAADTPRDLEESDDDEPFAPKRHQQPETRAMQREKTDRGPALPRNLTEEEDESLIGVSASADARAIENESGIDEDSESGLQVLAEDDEAPPRLRPIDTSDDDPFGDDKPASRRVPSIEPSVARFGDEDEFPSVSSVESLRKIRPETAVSSSNELNAADDEMPIIERAPPQRKPVAPSVPRVDTAVDDEADAFPNAGKRAGEEREPQRPAPESDLSLPLDDDPAPRADKSPSDRRADPFADNDGDDGLKAPPARQKIGDVPELPAPGRRAVPMLEDEPNPAPPARSTVTSTTDESEDAAEFRVEPQRTKPLPSSELRDEAPAREIPEPERVDDTARPSPTAVVASPPVARRRPQPQLTIDKIAPPTAVLGKPMIYQIVVKNVGPIAAREVVVEDAIPGAARIDGSIPQAMLDNQRLIWKLGTLEPGRETKVLVRMIPQTEGTIGTVATVNCASADRDANPAAPLLKFDLITPSQAIVGTPVEIKFRVANVGELDASGVVIRNVLPAGLRHPDGDDLEYEIGALPAGKSREIDLTLTAAQAGKTVNRAIVTAEGNVTEEASASLEIVGPALSLTRSGSKRLFPGKSGSYTNTVTNPDSRPIINVRVVETIPSGMEFGSATEGGQYDATKRTVTWTINQLGPQESRSLKTTLNATGRGAQISVVRAYDTSGASGETVGTTQVAGVPALTIDVGELAPHTDLGEQVRVPVRLLNRGSDTATNIRARVTLPPGMELASVHAPVDYQVGTDNALVENGPIVNSWPTGNPSRAVIRFSPIKRLEPRADVSIELVLVARQAGNARLRIEVECEQIAEPVSREEITTITGPQE